jgi:hypothetical protein
LFLLEWVKNIRDTGYIPRLSIYSLLTPYLKQPAIIRASARNDRRFRPKTAHTFDLAA